MARAVDVADSLRRRVGLCITPMVDEPRWLDAYLTRLCLIRWLSPDVELEGLGEGAMAWLGERVDEFFAALGYGDSEAPPPWRVVSHLDEASVAANLPRRCDRVVEYGPAAMALVARLSIAWFDALGASSKRVSAEARARVALDVWNALNDHALSIEGRDARGGGAPNVGLPGGNAAVMHAIWRLAHDGEATSPWAPLLALWERGACTLVTPGGELVVYVPRRVRTESGVTLAISPRATPEPYFESVISDDEMRRSLAPKGRNVVWCTVALELSRHGLGPLPGMYQPMNDREVPLARRPFGGPVPYMVFAPHPIEPRAVEAALHVWERPVLPASALTSTYPFWNTTASRAGVAPKR